MSYRPQAIPTVIDLGSSTCRAGLAGDEKPTTVFPTIVSEDYATDNGPIVGNEDTPYRYPIEHGNIRHWNDMEHIFNKIFNQQNSESVLISQPVHNPKVNKEKLAELLFEKYGVVNLCEAIDSVLCIYASGRHAGIVLQVGDGVTSVTPIEGVYPIPEAIIRSDIGGRDLTKYLKKMLSDNLQIGVDNNTAKRIKENCCYVRENGTIFSNSEATYSLPDGHKIVLNQDILNCTEALFDPTLINQYESPGLPEMLYTSIMKCGIDLRLLFANNIILAGCSTLFPGIDERIKNELESKVPAKMTINLLAKDVNFRTNAVWMGGSILASLSTFQNVCMSRNEYEEYGKSFVHKKFFSAIH